jgi:hypothetical protein
MRTTCCNIKKHWIFTTLGIYVFCTILTGRDSVVGIATGYELDGPGIKSRWGRDFQHPSRPALGPTEPLYNGYRVIPGGKAARVWNWPPTLI